MYMTVVPGLLVGVLTMGAGAVSDAFFFFSNSFAEPFPHIGLPCPASIQGRCLVLLNLICHVLLISCPRRRSK